jgi:hypothetical protein
MATKRSVSPSLLALALTYTLQLTGLMQWCAPAHVLPSCRPAAGQLPASC